jgi:ribose 1,5-bisphosphokinase
VVFAHRYITRPAEPHGENHIFLSNAEFDARLSAGLFAMYWNSHGLRYGIGGEIDLWLAKGCNVVVNGSREYLPEARRRYPKLVIVLVAVSAKTLEARLRARGRETEEQIAQRILRASQFPPPEGHLEIIDNNEALNVAGDHLVTLLSAQRAPR